MAISVLFAEDETELRTIVAEALAEEGLKIEAVEDGKAAMAALERSTFDVVLLDIKMPIATGLDVLEFMKKRGFKTRVIMATALDDMTTAVSSLKLGASDFITKPYSLGAILESIEKVLAR